MSLKIGDGRKGLKQHRENDRETEKKPHYLPEMVLLGQVGNGADHVLHIDGRPHQICQPDPKTRFQIAKYCK